MPIISVRDNENNRWKRKGKKNKEKKKQKGRANYGESVRAKWFCSMFKVGFVQLLCKASLIFKSNLELAYSIILKERELYESKHAVVECRCVKIGDLLSFLICSAILVLKLQQVSPSFTYYFFPNDFKFCAIKEDYIHLQWYSAKKWKCYS